MRSLQTPNTPSTQMERIQLAKPSDEASDPALRWPCRPQQTTWPRDQFAPPTRPGM